MHSIYNVLGFTCNLEMICVCRNECMLDTKLVAIYVRYEQLQCGFYSEASFLSIILGYF